MARWEFLLGKFLGLNCTVGLMALLMSLGFLGLLYAMDVPIRMALIHALAFVYLEALIITAIALLFSSFSTPYLSGFFAFGIFFIGHLSDDIRAFGEATGATSLLATTEVIYRIVPNLGRLNLKNQAVANVPLETSELALRGAYGMLYAVAVLVLAMGIFSKRDFK